MLWAGGARPQDTGPLLMSKIRARSSGSFLRPMAWGRPRWPPQRPPRALCTDQRALCNSASEGTNPENVEVAVAAGPNFYAFKSPAT
jgi:hypothetical protein